MTDEVDEIPVSLTALHTRLGTLKTGSSFRLEGYTTLPVFSVVAEGTPVLARNTASGMLLEFWPWTRVVVGLARCVLCGACAWDTELLLGGADESSALCSWCSQPSLRPTWTATRLRVQRMPHGPTLPPDRWRAAREYALGCLARSGWMTPAGTPGAKQFIKLKEQEYLRRKA